MLTKIGFRESADAIQKRWDQFVGLLGQTRPQGMDLRYPPALLERLRDFLHQGCGDLGLVSYDKQPVGPTEPNLTVLLNEAWRQFNEDPDTFAQWEQAQVEHLRTLLGRSEISEGW